MPLLRNRNMMQGFDPGKFVRVGTLISSLKWLGNFHITSLQSKEKE
jgi:hypothetical protein